MFVVHKQGHCSPRPRHTARGYLVPLPNIHCQHRCRIHTCHCCHKLDQQKVPYSSRQTCSYWLVYSNILLHLQDSIWLEHHQRTLIDHKQHSRTCHHCRKIERWLAQYSIYQSCSMSRDGRHLWRYSPDSIRGSRRPSMSVSHTPRLRTFRLECKAHPPAIRRSTSGHRTPGRPLSDSRHLRPSTSAHKPPNDNARHFGRGTRLLARPPGKYRRYTLRFRTRSRRNTSRPGVDRRKQRTPCHPPERRSLPRSTSEPDSLALPWRLRHKIRRRSPSLNYNHRRRLRVCRPSKSH